MFAAQGQDARCPQARLLVRGKLPAQAVSHSTIRSSRISPGASPKVKVQATTRQCRRSAIPQPAGVVKRAKLAAGRGCTQPENSEIHSKSQKAKKSKSFTFRKKLHFSTFRAMFSLFDFSGKNSKSLTFRKKLHFSTFRAKIQKVSLFAKSCTFRLFGQCSHFSTFRAKIQKVALFAKSCTFDIYLSPFPARNIGYGWIWDMPPTC